MARLIDADALIDDMCEDCGAFVNGACDKDVCASVLWVRDAPTIEAEPVRHGRWVPLSYDGHINGYPVYDEWECSECHFACEGEGEPPLNYCPNCGAKLDGGEKKNE